MFAGYSLLCFAVAALCLWLAYKTKLPEDDEEGRLIGKSAQLRLVLLAVLMVLCGIGLLVRQGWELLRYP